MRRVVVVVVWGVVVAGAPSPAFAGVGGAAPTVSAPGAASFPPPAAPTVARFAVSPGAVRQGGVARIELRVDGTTSSVRTRLDILRGGRHRIARIDLGSEPTGRVVSYSWRQRGKPGRYLVRLHAVDGNGQRLRRTARASGKVRLKVLARRAPAQDPAEKPSPTPTPPPSPTPTPAPAVVGSGRFPVQGTYTFGGPDARFGAGRTGHSHQGQDVMAAEGTPIVSPRAGVVKWRAYQAAGAGYYLVIHAGDGRDLVFMHLREGSLLVDKGATVAAGQRIADVGATGRAEGPHLHFEIWPGGWWAEGSSPIDPLPQLQAWAAGD